MARTFATFFLSFRAIKECVPIKISDCITQKNYLALKLNYSF